MNEFGGSIACLGLLQPDSEVEPGGRPPLELDGDATSSPVCPGESAGSVDPAADWQYAADPDPAAGEGVSAHHLLCQGRMVQSWRLSQGPPGAAHDRGG